MIGGDMQRQMLWTDQLLSDRSSTLFRAVYACELDTAEYDQLVEEVLDPEMAFFLRNSYRSLAFTEGCS
jgi:hypothetical protein